MACLPQDPLPLESPAAENRKEKEEKSTQAQGHLVIFFGAWVRQFHACRHICLCSYLPAASRDSLSCFPSTKEGRGRKNSINLFILRFCLATKRHAGKTGRQPASNSSTCEGLTYCGEGSGTLACTHKGVLHWRPRWRMDTLGYYMGSWQDRHLS